MSRKSNIVSILFSVESQGCEYEQHISIIKNPSPGSGSLTHFAFPELHPNVRLKKTCLDHFKQVKDAQNLHLIQNFANALAFN